MCQIYVQDEYHGYSGVKKKNTRFFKKKKHPQILKNNVAGAKWVVNSENSDVFSYLNQKLSF